jgi:hypothetical protein
MVLLPGSGTDSADIDPDNTVAVPLVRVIRG